MWYDKKYRVVEDNYCGFEVQGKRWWFPFWIQCSDFDGRICNTHLSLDRAKEFIKKKKNYKKAIWTE